MTELIFLAGLPLISIAANYFLHNRKAQYSISLLVASLHLITSYLIFSGLSQPAENEFIRFDALSRLFLLILSHVYFWVVLVSYSYLNRSTIVNEEKSKQLYFMMLNLYLFANTLALISNHLGLFWVASETTTLSVAPLIYYYRDEESLEAMWKYLFLVSVGIAFAFIGFLFLTLSASGTILSGQQLLISSYTRFATALNPIWLKASFIFVFVGLSTKIGIAPMHPGDIDATSNAPSPAAALMSGSLRGTALLGLMRVYQIMVPTITAEFARTIMTIGGMFSLFVAFVFMFKVVNYKRMLAYSSVEHLGLITLGIATGGVAFIGAMLHMVYNSLTKVVLFFNAGNIHRTYRSREVTSVWDVLNTMPWTGWLFLFGFFAIVAMPPFGIFFSEIMIFQGLMAKPILLAAVLFFLFFIFVGMSKTIFQMLYTAPPKEHKPIAVEKFEVIHFASLALLLLLIVLGLFMPSQLYTTVVQISKDFGITL
ncbi:MAG: proton-conducting transporter membrane subunit [Bacteroidota bacterium]|nr:proton-conducting transporter membrane subunit [Bacteroidota bacterium]